VPAGDADALAAALDSALVAALVAAVAAALADTHATTSQGLRAGAGDPEDGKFTELLLLIP